VLFYFAMYLQLQPNVDAAKPKRLIEQAVGVLEAQVWGYCLFPVSPFFSWFLVFCFPGLACMFFLYRLSNVSTAVAVCQCPYNTTLYNT
jgi:hypothetical protein